MATATTDKPTRARKPRPSTVPTTCQLVLFIGGESYHIKPIRSDFHARAFQVRKVDGTIYHVTQDEYGHHCDCKAGTYRDVPCRHVKAMRACLLLDALPNPETY